MSWLFDDEDEYKKDKNRQYTNGEITVFWKPATCIHATYCYKDLIEVFNPRNRPWVDMYGASTEKIIEVIGKCPTDALTWRWNDPEKNKEEAIKNIKIKQAMTIEEKQTDTDSVSIQIIKDGPVIVKGKYELFGVDGKVLKAMPIISFCRCGASNNMPFCDGMHRKIGFEADK